MLLNEWLISAPSPQQRIFQASAGTTGWKEEPVHEDSAAFVVGIIGQEPGTGIHNNPRMTFIDGNKSYLCHLYFCSHEQSPAHLNVLVDLPAKQVHKSHCLQMNGTLVLLTRISPGG